MIEVYQRPACSPSISCLAIPSFDRLALHGNGRGGEYCFKLVMLPLVVSTLLVRCYNMKPAQLIRLRTELDPQANYDRQGLLQAQQVVYRQEIQFTNKVDEMAQRQFPLKPLEIGFLQSTALKDDPKFKDIQRTYVRYNSELSGKEEAAVEGLHLKKVVMEAMLKFLNLMMLAPDTATKKTILDISYYWFQRHLNPRSQRLPKQQLLNEIRQVVAENRLLPQAVLDAHLPSHKRREELKEYRAKARTCYTEFDAPAAELENYHTHKVGYIQERPREQPSEEAERRRRLARVQFKRPNLEQYYLPPPEEQKEELKEEQKEELKEEKKDVPPGEEKPGEAPKPEGEVPVEPENPQLAQEMEMLNQMGGEPEEPEEQPPEEDEDKKRGKLDPLVKVFLLKQAAQTSFPVPPATQQRERYRLNYQQEVQREDENFSRGMNQWAAHRSRLKTEISRKMQSMRAFSKPPTAVLKPAFEETFYQTRISEAVRGGRSYLQGELSKEALNTETGLSCFDRRRVKTVSGGKAFAQILEENKRSNKREEWLEEIEDIKGKFAKGKVFTSLHAMRGGLMHPEEQPDETTDKLEYPVSLLSNPFFVVKKKKKKGKKKK